MNLRLREATEADAETLFRWRNDPDVRANSFHTESIPYGEHLAWLGKTLRDPAQEIYILCEGETPVGQVRLSTEGDVATVSYSIDAAYRAQGFGRTILQLAENICVGRGRPCALRGLVKEKNIASQVIFEALGYTKEEAHRTGCVSYIKRELQMSSIEEQICGGGILFLTNNRNALPLYEWLCEQGDNVALHSGRISLEMLARLRPCWVISYNYSHIVLAGIIANLRGRIVNLHASLLPWNRGASPNFWSFVEDTPKGISIHFMDEGLDTGEIIAQEEIAFDENEETFRSSYRTLNKRMLQLFCSVWPKLSAGKMSGKRQSGTGSYHSTKDFSALLDGEAMDWDVNIAAFKKRWKERCDLFANEKKADDHRGDERQP